MNAIRPLVFQSTTFTVVDRFGQPWLRGPQIAGALGYNRPDRIADIYARNAAEFTDSMTALVELDTAGGRQQVRIFSLRGAHLIGMFARTARAAEFRRWVLDVLEGITPPQPTPPMPVVLSLPGEGRYLVVIDADRPAPHVIDASLHSLVRSDYVVAVQRDLATLEDAMRDMRHRLRLLQGEANPRVIEQPLSIVFSNQ